MTTEELQRLVDNTDGVCPRCLHDESYGCSCSEYEMRRFYADLCSDFARELIAARRVVEAASDMRVWANGNYTDGRGERAFLSRHEEIYALDAAISAYEEAKR